jgi:hypothetical protein
MQIKSVIEKQVVIINGKEYLMKVTNWTSATKRAIRNKIELNNENEVAEWVCATRSPEDVS